jgi:hypothetical protein
MTLTRGLRLAGRVASGVGLAAAGAVNAGLCLLVAGFSCDEGCVLFRGEGTRPGVSWRDTADAWQWSAIGWLGVASFVCAALCGVTLGVRRRAIPVTFLAAAVITGLAPWLWLR